MATNSGIAGAATAGVERIILGRNETAPWCPRPFHSYPSTSRPATFTNCSAHFRATPLVSRRPFTQHSSQRRCRGRSHHRSLGTRCDYGRAAVASAPQMEGVAGIMSYSFFVEGGGKVAVTVARDGGFFKVTVGVDTKELNWDVNKQLLLHWGLTRSDKFDWVNIDNSLLPPESHYANSELQGMMTALWGNSMRKGAELTIEGSQAPLYLNFELYQYPAFEGDQARSIRRTGGVAFAVPIGMRKGCPEPLGVTWTRGGSANFALYSRHAEGVVLCLYSDDNSPNPQMEIDLVPSIHRTGDVWHLELERASEFRRYGYRCKGEVTWDRGNRFHARPVLLDPYAGVLARYVPGQEDLPAPAVALGQLVSRDMYNWEDWDWEEDFPPCIPMEQLVVYRLNVDTFTSSESSGLPESSRGTFAGISEKIDHLQSLGINAILLDPITASDPLQGINFPLSFFAPEPRYGPNRDGLSASRALKQMVKELHRRGIEVLLNVSFSHTAERNDDEPNAVSFRGIDAATYYICDQFGKQLRSDNGGASMLNCNNPVTQKLIIDCLRHWVVEYHVDGFVFSDAQSLLLGPHGQLLSRPLLVESLAFDPVLASTKLVADTCSPVSGTCRLLAFPHWGRWAETNHLFRDDIRRFMRGEQSQLSGLATRIFGSGDLFAAGRGPGFGLNFLTSPPGFTLADLVTYSSPGGGDMELSWNCGEEGGTADEGVINLRARQVRNFMVALLVSQGIPVISMGDEYGISTGGSTGSDRQMTAFDWRASQEKGAKDLVAVISTLAVLRQRYRSIFQRPTFLASELVWHGREAGCPEWDSGDSCFLAASFHPEPNMEETGASSSASSSRMGTSAADSSRGAVYVAFNAQHYNVQVSLPHPPEGTVWHRVLDSSRPPRDALGWEGSSEPLLVIGGYGPALSYTMDAYSSLVLEAISPNARAKL